MSREKAVFLPFSRPAPSSSTTTYPISIPPEVIHTQSCLRRPVGGVALQNQRHHPPHQPASPPAAQVNNRLLPAPPDALPPNEVLHHHPQCSFNPLQQGQTEVLKPRMSVWPRPARPLMTAREHHGPTTQEFEVGKKKPPKIDCFRKSISFKIDHIGDNPFQHTSD